MKILFLTNILCLVLSSAFAGGTVSGFDFNGLQVRAELPSDFACASIATLESDACYKIGGSTIYDEHCNNLCTSPISKN